MNSYQQRQEAVQRFLKGEHVTHIAMVFKKSRKWVHHWINQYNLRTDELSWFKDRSKAPKKSSSTLSIELEAQILQIRKELVNERMAQIGAISIQYQCELRGIKPIPSVWTINRLIKKHGLNTKPSGYKSPIEYPELFLHTHQLDLVGPRYIKGDGRYYSVNILDISSHTCFVEAVRTKASENILQAIASFWKIHGIPDALQMDNELAFRGSNRFPRSYGNVVRFALSLGVVVIFIPLGEPWRNGKIEQFNNTYQKKFVNTHTFKNLEDLSMQEQKFIQFHNSHHRYSAHGQKTPDQVKSLQLSPTYYNGTIHLPNLNPKIKIPLTEGNIFYIRFIRSDLKLHLANEVFIMKPELKYSYVVAIINIENQLLIIRQNDEIKEILHYPMTIKNK